MDGNTEQAAFFRFQKTATNGTVLKAQFYDTFAYTAGAFQNPHQVPASGEPAGSAVARDFYACVLNQHHWWANELASEGMTRFSLPADADGTDGPTLANMSKHSVVRDMITRRNTYFPKYGVLGGGNCKIAVLSRFVALSVPLTWKASLLQMVSRGRTASTRHSSAR